MTVCVSHVYHPYPSWMITSGSCEPRHGWSPEFSFYVAASLQQQNSRWSHKRRKLKVNVGWSFVSVEYPSLQLCSLITGGCTLHSSAWDLIPAGCVSTLLAAASAPGLMDPHRESFILLFPVVSQELSMSESLVNIETVCRPVKKTLPALRASLLKLLFMRFIRRLNPLQDFSTVLQL